MPWYFSIGILCLGILALVVCICSLALLFFAGASAPENCTRKAVIFQNPGFWRLKAPETRIWAPEGALDGDPYIKDQKKANIHRFFAIFSSRFSKYLAPSGAKYREKGWAVTKTGEG